VADVFAGLRIIDISNPAAPMEVGFFDTGSGAYGVYVSGSYAYVADGDDGLYIIRNDLITGIIYDGGGHAPEAFALEQNYPNPFNPTTTIEFSLPYTEFVTLKICNILGEEVATLVKEKQTAGEKSAVWDGRDRFGR